MARERRRFMRVLRWVVGHLPALLAWAGLVGLFVYGSKHEWKFGDKKDAEKEKKAKPDDDRESFTPYFAPQPGDVPVWVSHNPLRCPVQAAGVARLIPPAAAAAVAGTVGWFPPARVVKFKSPEAAERAGIKTAAAELDWVAVTVEAHGEVRQDPTVVAQVSPRAGGALYALEKQLGDRVKRGELLALVDSAEVGRAKAAYLTARATTEAKAQIRQSLEGGAVPPRSVVEAEAALREARANLFGARQAIENLGLPVPPADEKLSDDELTRRLAGLGIPGEKWTALNTRDGRPPPANLLPVFSPLDGVVTKRTGVAGETVAAGAAVFEVADPTKVHVVLDVRLEDQAGVKVGQEMTFTAEGQAAAAAGEVDLVSPAVDEKTRTVRVRGRVPNAAGALKSGAFGAGAVTTDGPWVGVVVPRDAVHWEGCCHMVFVKKSDTEYEVRRVTLGVRAGDVVEIESGLSPGEEVAVTGSHVLKSELLKERIGEADE
jgi:cobalt-zinc-cadmium efflux system membrane fusion protein